MSFQTIPFSEGAAPVSPFMSGGAAARAQRTLATAVDCSGIGVHSGKKVAMRLCPAETDTGIVFVRTDLMNGARAIKARWDSVVDTRLCTAVGNAHGGRVGTIEHLMAAIGACGIDNISIEIDGPEVPVMDGSSDSFLFLIEIAGTAAQNALKREIEILSPIEVEQNGKRVRLSPCEKARYSMTIDFKNPPILKQSCDVTLTPESFKNEIGRARTFGFFEEVDQMQKMGLALGGSLQNSIIIKDGRVLNEEGLRYGDEFVRHKVLDAIGDLTLAGMPIRGHFEGHCSGHALNNRLLHKLFDSPKAWRAVECGTSSCAACADS